MKWFGVGLLVLAGCATTRAPLSEALTDWAERTGYNIIVPVCRETRRQSRQIAASDPKDELEQLIDGTGLGYIVVNPRTVAIVCP